MHYTLYGCPNTASTGIRVLLEELAPFGVTYTFENVNLPQKEQKRAEYLAVNPKGRVPAVVIDGEAISETGALALLLAERHPDAPLAPAAGTPGRARFLETHIEVVNSLLPTLRDWFYADRDQTDPEHAKGIRLLAVGRLQAFYELVDDKLSKTRYLTSNDNPTATDYIFLGTLSWNGFIDALAARYPNVKRYRDEMRARPSWQHVAKVENIELTMRDFEKEFLASL